MILKVELCVYCGESICLWDVDTVDVSMIEGSMARGSPSSKKDDYSRITLMESSLCV